MELLSNDNNSIAQSHNSKVGVDRMGFLDFWQKPIFDLKKFRRKFFSFEKHFFLENIARGLSYESLVIGNGPVVAENRPSEVWSISGKPEDLEDFL